MTTGQHFVPCEEEGDRKENLDSRERGDPDRGGGEDKWLRVLNDKDIANHHLPPALLLLEHTRPITSLSLSVPCLHCLFS